MRTIQFAKAWPRYLKRMENTVETIINPERLVTYSSKYGKLPSERATRLWLGVYGATIFGSFTIALFIALGAGMWAAEEPPRSVSVEGLTGYIVVALILSNLVFIGLFAIGKSRQHDEVLQRYTEVPQGMVVELIHEETDQGARFGVIVHGNNRLNQLRKQTHWMSYDKWAAYQVGDYVEIP